jgi:hypothetical protein
MSIARQWLGKHIPAAMDMHTTIEELLKMVFPMWSAPEFYSEDQLRVGIWYTHSVVGREHESNLHC